MFQGEKKLDVMIMVLILIAIAVVPLVYLPYQDTPQVVQLDFNHYAFFSYDNIYKPKFNLLLLVELILLIMVYFKIRIAGSFFKWHFSYVPLSFFLILLFLSTMLSPYFWIALYGRTYRYEGLVTYFAYIILFLITVNFINNWSRLRMVLKYLFISALLISIYGLFQFFGLDFIPRDPVRINWSTRAFSTLGNPDFAGSYISMLLPLAFILYIYADKKEKIYLYGLLSTIFYAFMIGTSTRSAWLAFILTIPVICLFAYNHIKANLKRILILLLVFVMVTLGMDVYQGGYLSTRLISIFLDAGKLVYGDEMERSRVGSNRLFIYKTSWPLLWDRPFFGSGPDTFAEVFPQEMYWEFTGRREIVDKAHCEYLQLGVTTGIPALLSYFWFLFIILRQGLKRLRKKNKYQLALFTAFISYSIQAAFNISVVSVAPVFWAVMGLNVAANNLLENCK